MSPNACLVSVIQWYLVPPTLDAIAVFRIMSIKPPNVLQTTKKQWYNLLFFINYGSWSLKWLGLMTEYIRIIFCDIIRSQAIDQWLSSSLRLTPGSRKSTRGWPQRHLWLTENLRHVSKFQILYTIMINTRPFVQIQLSQTADHKLDRLSSPGGLIFIAHV